MIRRLVAAAALFVLSTACVTINVYFPEAAVNDLSQQIEREVQKEAAKKLEEGKPAPQNPPAPQPDAPQPPRGGGGGPQAGLFDALFGVTPAYAAGNVPAPEVSSPAIRRVIESRAARVADIDRYKASGALGENNKALLEVRSLESLDLKARADVQKLVRAENADREELFREIAAAKKVDPGQVDRIRETYAGTLRDNARPGDWIQGPDGTWNRK